MPEHPGDRHDRRGRPERAPPGRLHGRGRARRHGQPEPEPEGAEPERDGLEARLRRPARHREEAGDAEREPAERDEPERDDPDDEARRECPDRRRAGQRPERETLLVRAAVQDPVHEHRATDDRGRERIARQQRHERGRRERHAPEEARVEERVVRCAEPRTTAATGRQRRQPKERERDDQRVQRRPGDVLRARGGSARAARRRGRRRRSRRRRCRSALRDAASPSRVRQPRRGPAR